MRTRCARPASRQSSWRSLAAPKRCGLRAESKRKEIRDMAKTKRAPKAETKKSKVGHVSQVIGAVVDVEFPAGGQPELFEALGAKTPDGRVVGLWGEGPIGDNRCRPSAMAATS